MEKPHIFSFSDTGQEVSEREKLRIRDLQLEFYEICKPFVRMKLDIMDVANTTLIVRDGQIVERHYDPETERLLAEVDALLEEEIKLWKERTQWNSPFSASLKIL
jgi:hypothetical protein